jgi:Ca2+/Na+ antiporter
MPLKLILYILTIVLLVLAAAIITGQFDVHPAAGIALALAAVLLAAYSIRKKKN